MSGEAEATKVGGNVTDKTLQEHAQAILAAKRDRDEAQLLHQLAWKAAKKVGIDIDVLKIVMKKMEQTSEEIAADMATERRYFAWLGRPIGEQSDLFADATAAEPEPVNAFSKGAAEQAGYNAGLNREPVTNCEYEHGSELAAEWVKGHGKGTAFLERKAEPDAEPGIVKATPRSKKTGGEQVTPPSDLY
jgi:hypothetical protein